MSVQSSWLDSQAYQRALRYPIGNWKIKSIRQSQLLPLLGQGPQPQFVLGKFYITQYVSFFPQKLFIEQSDSTWLCLQIDQISVFMDSLNKKTINESRLLHKVQEYYQGSINKHLSKMEVETEENNMQNRSGNCLKTLPSL